MPKYLFLPIRTPNGHYVYDGNTNSIVKLNQEVYNALVKIFRGSGTEGDAQRIKCLQKRGFCLESKVEEIRHPSLDDMEYYVGRYIRMVTLQVTRNCNLRCAYCTYSGEHSNRSHENRRMDQALAFRIIDFAIAHSSDTEILGIGFYGGEPLLEFSLIQSCVQYTLEKYPNREVSFSMTTNGTLLSEQVIDFLDQHDFTLLLSLDGPKEMHDLNRKYVNGNGSFDNIMQNLSEFQSRYPEFYNKLGTNTVVSDNHSYVTIRDFYNTNPLLKDLDHRTTIVNDATKLVPNEYSDEFFISTRMEKSKLYLYLLGRITKDSVTKLEYAAKVKIDSLIEGFIPHGPLPKVWHHSGPCIAGVSRPFFDIDGNIYPCERVSEKSEVMRIGHLDTGVDLERAAKLINIGLYSEEACKRCWNLEYCTICASKIDDNGVLSKELKIAACEDSKNDTYQRLQEYILLKEYDYTPDQEELA